jgi:hypothetical protein
MKIEPEGCKPFTVCHGSLFKAKDWIFKNNDLVDKNLNATDTDLLICGHTHKYCKAEKNNKTIIFAASIGLPADGLDSRFLMLEYKSDNWTDRNIFFTYDKQSFINDYYTSGFCDKAFYWAKSIIKMIETNNSITLQTLKLAEKYSKEENNSNLSGIPEIYWERAAKELRIE